MEETDVDVSEWVISILIGRMFRPIVRQGCRPFVTPTTRFAGVYRPSCLDPSLPHFLPFRLYFFLFLYYLFFLFIMTVFLSSVFIMWILCVFFFTSSQTRGRRSRLRERLKKSIFLWVTLDNIVVVVVFVVVVVVVVAVVVVVVVVIVVVDIIVVDVSEL